MTEAKLTEAEEREADRIWMQGFEAGMKHRNSLLSSEDRRWLDLLLESEIELSSREGRSAARRLLLHLKENVRQAEELL